MLTGSQKLEPFLRGTDAENVSFPFGNINGINTCEFVAPGLSQMLEIPETMEMMRVDIRISLV